MTRVLLIFLAVLLTACGVEQKDFDLDPRPHRDMISGIENLLYAPQPPKIEDTERLGRMIDSLAGSLDGGRPPGPSAKAAAAVRAWKATVVIPGEAGYVQLDLPVARRAWEAVRDENFRPEPFFKVATGDLDDLQRSRTGGVDPMQLTLITLLAGELSSVLEKGRQEAEAFEDVGGDIAPDSPEATALRSEWAEWQASFDRKLGAVDWPERPPLAAEELSLIYQQLKNGETELAKVTTQHATGVTPKADRVAALAEAGKLIDDAKKRLDALRQ